MTCLVSVLFSTQKKNKTLEWRSSFFFWRYDGVFVKYKTAVFYLTFSSNKRRNLNHSNLDSKKYSPTIKMTKISINKICYSFDHISFKFKPLRKVISDYHSWLSYLIVVCSCNPGSIIVIFVYCSEYPLRIYDVKKLKLYYFFDSITQNEL
jgi:hypothetical protein